jgi:hypothetical protein
MRIKKGNNNNKIEKKIKKWKLKKKIYKNI